MAASNINLLPIDLSAKSGVAKSAALLKRISMFLIVIFMILGLMAGVFVVIFSLQLENAVKQNQSLASQISTLEVTEQKTVLIKDRLQKIKGIRTQTDITSAVDGIKTVSTTLPAGVTIADVSVDVSKTNFSFNVVDSSVLVSFLSTLVANSTYKQLVIKNFSFTPANGYLVSFEATSR